MLPRKESLGFKKKTRIENSSLVRKTVPVHSRAVLHAKKLPETQVQVVQEIIDRGRGSILKIGGTWLGKRERMKEVRAASVRWCCLLRASATLLNSPLKCWLYRQHLDSINSVAYFRDAMWRALLFSSSVFALCSHPTADELSPRARIQDNSGVEVSSRQSHVVMMAARNSSKLFLFLMD